MLDRNLKGEGAAVAHPPQPSASEPTEAFVITYRTLLERHLSGVSRSTAKATELRVNKWLVRWKKDWDSPVGNELTVEFDRYFSAFRNSIARTERSDKAAGNTAVDIRSLRRTYIAWVNGTEFPTDFTGTLRKAMVLAGLTYKGLLRAYKAEYGQTISQLSKWLSGRTSPNYTRTRERGRQTLVRLERLLKLNPGVLTERAFADAPRVLLAPSGKPIKFREHHSMLVNDPRFRYQLRPLPAHLEETFGALEAWRKTERHYIPGKGYIGVPEKERWNSEKTVNLYRRDFEAFFGFLCLPTTIEIPDDLPAQLGNTVEQRHKRYQQMCTGLGMRPEDLRFTMLVDHELVNRYVEFRRVRNLLEGTTKSVLAEVIRHNSLLAHKDLAFLRCHPEFGNELKPRVTKNWQGWCDKRHREMRELINSMNKTVLKGRTREPDEPVKHVFAQKDPAKVLTDMARHMLKTLPPPSCRVSRALQYRNAVLVLLMTYEPLRAGHWTKLRLGKHIYRDEGQDRYVIDVKAAEFKNWIWGYAKDRFRVLPESLSELVDNYVHTHRPRLHLAEASDLFLLKSRTGNSIQLNPGPQMTEQGFYNLIADLLQKYLGVPVGPHVVRHIQTTDFLRRHPGDFETAGAVLNDSPETVRANYSHVKQKDLLDRRDQEYEQHYKGLK